MWQNSPYLPTCSPDVYPPQELRSFVDFRFGYLKFCSPESDLLIDILSSDMSTSNPLLPHPQKSAPYSQLWIRKWETRLFIHQIFGIAFLQRKSICIIQCLISSPRENHESSALLIRFFTNLLNWRYRHECLYYVKTKNSATKCYPQWALNWGPLPPQFDAHPTDQTQHMC